MTNKNRLIKTAIKYFTINYSFYSAIKLIYDIYNDNDNHYQVKGPKSNDLVLDDKNKDWCYNNR